MSLAPPPLAASVEPAPLSGNPVAAAFERLPRAARLTCWLLGTRALAALTMVIGTYFPKKDLTYWHGHVGDFFFRHVPWRILDVWGRWDTDFYISISQVGYLPMDANHDWQWQAAYFPLLPSLMRGLSTLLGGANPYLCGLFIANAMLVLAVIYVDKLAQIDRPPEMAELIVACLMAYPGSHWFSCVYPESCALFLGVFAVYCARKDLALAAGLACGLSALARSSGILVCLPVLYEFCRRDDGRLRWSWRALWLAFPALTLGMHMAVMQSVFHDPLYFAHVQAGWGRKPAFFLWSIITSRLEPHYHLWAAGSLALLYIGFRQRERLGYMLLGAAGVLLPLSTGMLRGIHRYMGSNFPLFFVLARWLWERPRWRRAYLGIGLIVLAAFSFKWGQGFQPN